MQISQGDSRNGNISPSLSLHTVPIALSQGLDSVDGYTRATLVIFIPEAL